jgi:CheY-like chemotaxis protein
MTPPTPPPDTPSSPPEQFIEQVREALENLYDLPALNRHPLAANAPQSAPSEPQGQRLRRELINTIEALNPSAKHVGARPTANRAYTLLHMHYVGGMTLQEAANQLGVSLRQAYRDLKAGCDGVAELMWFNRRGAAAEADAVHVSSLASELARLEANVTPADLAGLCGAALKAVQRLTAQYGLSVRAELPPAPAVVAVNPAAAQQVLISLLSGAIQAARPETALTLTLRQDGQVWAFDLTFAPREAKDLVLPAPIMQVIDQMRLSVAQARPTPDQCSVRLSVPAYGTRVLVVDDNLGLLDLLQRFLPEPRYKVFPASTGADGLSLAGQVQPDVILLDLMMPDLNGWDVLQTLRADPRTREIPVVVCSVVSDPELAYSLGANAVIAKPITREGLLAVLEQLGV